MLLNYGDEEPSRLIDYLDSLFWIVSILGVFGYAFQKEILNVKFWKVFLPFIVVWDIFIIIDTLDGILEISEPMLIIGIVIMYAGILIPQYIGLYLYGYKYLFKST